MKRDGVFSVEGFLGAVDLVDAVGFAAIALVVVFVAVDLVDVFVAVEDVVGKRRAAEVDGLGCCGGG